MEPAINYLDIQLRDMDYDKKYDSLTAKFLDPKQIYYRENNKIVEPLSVYEKGFNKAFDTAAITLNQKRQSGKLRTDSLWDIFKSLYIERVERERLFLKAWKSHYNKFYKTKNLSFIKSKIPEPPSANSIPTEKQMTQYALNFSKFIYILLGVNSNPEDSLIIETLRDPSFIDRIAGQSSAVFSTKAAKRAANAGAGGKKSKPIRVGQSMINSYYEELFGVFCLNRQPQGFVNKFDGRGAYLTLEDTLLELNKNEREYLDKNGIKRINSVKPQTVFQKNFKRFIDKYYPELSEKIGKDFFDNVCAHFNDIYQINGENTKNTIILHGVNINRGVSYDNEQQLKKMFLETIRWGSGHTGDYSDFEIPGLLEIKERWDQGNQYFYKQIQLRINHLRNNFALEGEAGKDRRMTYEKILDENGELIHDENKPLTRRNVEEYISNYFFEWLVSQIKIHTGQQISDEGKTKLKRATLAKLSGYYTWGNELLKKLSAFGPQQVRGLMGEIATAYSIEAHSGLGNEIVGSSYGSAGTGQLHYDVEARLNGLEKNIGFQVKNFKTGDSINGLYATSLGLGTQAMYRYFSKEDVKSYRWLFANGFFLSRKGGDRRFNGEESLRKKMEESFLDAMPYFLRIGDAANGELKDQVNSDIYVIGNYYYPSSYLIIAAYRAAREKMEKVRQDSDLKRLISITGQFPNYSRKYQAEGYFREKEYITNSNGEKVWSGKYLMTSRQKYNQVRVSSTGKSQMREKANLVWIDRLKTRVLDATINFSGITVKFKI